MNINIEKKNISELKGKGSEIINSFFNRYDSTDLNSEEVIKIDLAQLSDEAVDSIESCLNNKTRTMRIARCLNLIIDWKAAKSNPNDKVIDSLKTFISVLKEYIRKSDHYLLFKNKNGHMFPRFVENIKYYERKKDEPAHVDLDMRYYDGSKKCEACQTFYLTDVLNERCSLILNNAGLVIENENLFKDYLRQYKIYEETSGKIGTKYLASGIGKSKGKWGSSEMSMIVEGEKTPVVIDKNIEIETGFCNNKEEKEIQKETSVFTCTFWNDKKMRSMNKKVIETSSYRNHHEEEVVTDEDTKEDEITFNAPLSPYLPCFNLIKHEYVNIHVDDLEIYKYDKTLGEKLILPNDVKDLLKVLINHSNSVFQDIITGKAGGTIILCTGEPGTGKTLTAEVYAEIMERPLYCVQSSQLGITAEDLEYELKTVLNRATRWKGILLIDEADVYIHNRGSDINQNAVVGVFLRVLEYYKGVLFLTTNRSTLVDDAIASRATAKICYHFPTPENLKKIWQVISKNSKVSISESVIDEAVKMYPKISGRDVRSLIKLVNLMTMDNKSTISLSNISHAMKFKQTEYQDEILTKETI